MLTHISNNFLGSKVHSNLVNSLASQGVSSQFVYCPLQKYFKKDKTIKVNKTISLFSPRILTSYIRYFPLFKVIYSLVFFLIELRRRKIKPSFIVAHNLWSDGLIAWFYFQLTGTAYTVAIRNTDINHFIPKLLHYRWLIKRILFDAKKVVFINQAYKKRVSSEYPTLYKSIKDHDVIYNGIDSEWVREMKSDFRTNPVRQVCYIGTFNDNKNLRNAVYALELLRARDRHFEYVAIGGTEKDFLEITGYTDVPKWVKIVPYTNDKKLIRGYLKNSCIFLMPSFKETFGLVYIEALSQGCCLVHSVGEGIDGVFNEDFIKSVNPYSTSEIAQVVDYCLERYPNGVSKDDVNRLVTPFSWNNIAKNYLKIIK